LIPRVTVEMLMIAADGLCVDEDNRRFFLTQSNSPVRPSDAGDRAGRSPAAEVFTAHRIRQNVNVRGVVGRFKTCRR
jgi:hypothetical protein